MFPSIEPAEVGNTGLIWLFVTYGFVLYRASELISEGSELLLLVPSLAGLVGGVVLPLLGAVPDGAIMLFSGMGDIETAQESLSVGIGALAGSTIMLLTIPWGLSILAGSVKLQSDGEGNKKADYTSPKQIDDSLTENGVAITEQINKGSRIMMYTSVPFFLIQVPAFFMEKNNVAKGEKYWALLSLLICISGFVGYLYINVKASQSDQEKNRRTQVMISLMKKGKISLSGALTDMVAVYDSPSQNNQNEGYASIVDDDGPSLKVKDYLSVVLKSTFNSYDTNADGSLEISEIQKFFHDFNENLSNRKIEILFKEYDKDSSGHIDFDEFILGVYSFLKVGATPVSTRASILAGDIVANVLSNDDEEEEDVPEEIANLPADEQQAAIKKMAFSLLAFGTALVLLFADPMVDVMQEIAVRIDISPFYVSFVLAPLASNASEVIASQYYASKKTTKTITVSLSALLGAACMNNTFCLAIFMGLIYFRGLAWQYTAETISIVLVQFIIYYMTKGKTQTKLEGLLIMAIFPLSIALVAGLEALGLD